MGEPVLPLPTVTSHTCSWWSLAGESDSPLVTVEFMISSTDPYYRGSYPVETSACTQTIADRPSFTFETEDGECVVNAYHALLGGVNKDRRGIASLTVGAIAEDPCAVARKLTEQAWPRLPDLRE